MMSKKSGTQDKSRASGRPGAKPAEEDAAPSRHSIARMVPNSMTTVSLCAGLSALHFAISERYEAAVLALVVAAILDGLDGAVARLLKAQSRFGAELDSLSDFLCFGVAPAVTTHIWVLHEAGKFGLMAALVYPVAAALRLARFNTEAADSEHAPPKKVDPRKGKYFVGIPAPGAAGLCLLPLIISFLIEIAPQPGNTALGVAYSIWLLVLAGGMISRLPTVSLKKLQVPHKFFIPALAGIGIFVGSLINAPWPTLTLVGLGYITLFPIGFIRYRREFGPLIANDDIGHDDGDDDDEEMSRPPY